MAVKHEGKNFRFTSSAYRHMLDVSYDTFGPGGHRLAGLSLTAQTNIHLIRE